MCSSRGAPLYGGEIARGQAATSSLAWFEYACGPVAEIERLLVHVAIGRRIIPVDEFVAERAAVLFNAAGRRRRCARTA